MSDEKISLNLLNESLDRVGKRQMEAGDLKKFVIETLKHETKMLQERKKEYDNEEISENEINNFEFYNDGYHTGIYIKLKDENIYSLGKDKDGEDIQVIQMVKKDPKTKEAILDENGDEILTNRCRMKIKSRLGGVGIFLGKNKLESLESGDNKHYVLVGGMTITNIVANPKSQNREDMYHKVKEEGIKYSGRTFTFNLWQIAEIFKKGKNLAYKVDFDCNWKEDDAE